MLILLPPSEGKKCPDRGPGLSLSDLRDQQLTAPREQVVAALLELCNGSTDDAAQTLGLSARLADWVDRNRDLRRGPTAPAATIYTGVLFHELGLAEMSDSDFRLANERLIIFSALFGLVRPDDEICCYRLSGGTTLPQVGRITSFWRESLAKAMPTIVADDLVVDMRSSPYNGMWSPTPDQLKSFVTVKVWQESPSGQRTAVSHHNKASKGALARELATVNEQPKNAAELLDLVSAAGWRAELTESGKSTQLDLYISK